MIKSLFFDLIRVAIGRQECLSGAPSREDWEALFAMAEKQALMGVCFAGIGRLQKVGADVPMDLYMKWLAVAANIQQRNELLNRGCVRVQQLLAEEGMTSSILKGQGVACLYPEYLWLLRQSGDIDVYVPCGMKEAMAYAQRKYGKVDYDYINAHVPMLRGVEVELHWRVQAMSNLLRNRRLQRWLEREETKRAIMGDRATLPDGQIITVPTDAFNAFYLMLHAYNHEISSGLGLRQLMDYYFLLVHLDARPDTDVNAMFKAFGMQRFARGVMWIMQEVFGLERERLLCESDEKEGRFILGEVMAGGNFGHHDERIKKVGRGKWQSVFATLQHAMHVLRRHPSEALWMPVWMVYHFIWKRI